MAKRGGKPKRPESPHLPVRRGWRGWHKALLTAAAILIVFEVYRPALKGPFVLDDLYTPYGQEHAEGSRLEQWLGRRPILMTTFFLNYQWGRTDTYGYHMVNVVLHLVTGALVFVILRKLLESYENTMLRRLVLAGTGTAVFLLHPMQTESVAYIASRSDVLSTLFCYAALVIFVSRRNEGVSFAASFMILMLLGLAVMAKEQAVGLVAALLILDLFDPASAGLQGVRRNWKLHGAVVAGGLAGVAFVFHGLRGAVTAGFGTEGILWYEYFFTQCRVIWKYLILLVFPVGQNVDPDVRIAGSITEPGTLVGLAGIVALIILAWIIRKRWPLAAAGILIFLALIAPTSSFVPIKDPMAERRVYFPFVGFLLILLEFARRLKSTNGLIVAGVTVTVILGSLTYSRAAIWGNDIALWEDSVKNSPRKYRPRFQLAYAYYAAGRSREAVTEFEKAAALDKPKAELFIDWALALDSGGRAPEALDKLRQAAQLENTAHVHSLIGMVYGKQNKNAEALAALAEAEKLDPNFAPTFVYRGNVLAALGDWSNAAGSFRRALAIDPRNQGAAQGLRLAENRMSR